MEDLSRAEAHELVRGLNIDALELLGDAVRVELQKRRDTIVPTSQTLTVSEGEKWLIRHKWYSDNQAE